MNLRDLLARRAALAVEMRALDTAAGDAALSSEQQATFNRLKGELDALEQRIHRVAAVDEAERRAAGTPLAGAGTGDRPGARIEVGDGAGAGAGRTGRRIVDDPQRARRPRHPVDARRAAGLSSLAGLLLSSATVETRRLDAGVLAFT